MPMLDAFRWWNSFQLELGRLLAAVMVLTDVWEFNAGRSSLPD